jgi:hypothetical protein
MDNCETKAEMVIAATIPSSIIDDNRPIVKFGVWECLREAICLVLNYVIDKKHLIEARASALLRSIEKRRRVFCAALMPPAALLYQPSCFQRSFICCINLIVALICPSVSRSGGAASK